MGSRRYGDRSVTAFQHPVNLIDIGRVRAQLNSGWQRKRAEAGILARKEEAMKHRIGFGNDADTIPTLQSQSKQTPGQCPRFVTKFTVTQYGFQLTPVVIKIETGFTLGSIVQRIREIHESMVLYRKLIVQGRWLHDAFI
jgi:hypothetical protein